MKREEIEKLCEKFNTYPYNVEYDDEQEDEHNLYIKRKDRQIGRIKIHKVSEGLWTVMNVFMDISYREKGKSLYYLIMDKIYPAYIRPNEVDVSRLAINVWNSMGQAKYVQTKTLSKIQMCCGANNDEGIDIDIKCRFKL